VYNNRVVSPSDNSFTLRGTILLLFPRLLTPVVSLFLILGQSSTLQELLLKFGNTCSSLMIL
jgi:hypothetical protein